MFYKRIKKKKKKNRKIKLEQVLVYAWCIKVPTVRKTKIGNNDAGNG